ncbi:MAG: radical SAM family heme chaperone HemW [Flavobacteriaceae bacterium]|nr:radical SAM family heme chaperone HemW [Flavobacteriaceae bacterium]
MSGIYIHIPFCKQACHYCDFHFSTTMKKKDEMVDAICSEIVLRKEELTTSLKTIYFGGGTPSLLSEKEIEKVFEAINENFEVEKDAEITLEANPDDLTNEVIAQLSKSPINRLSIGVQSFFEEDLQLMNRAHNASEAKNCIIEAKKHFDNISIDLIYGIPGMSNDRWKQNLELALSLEVPHISSYALTVEPKTALESFINKGKIIPTLDTEFKEQYELLLSKMEEAGFVNYEFSNFGKEGYFSKNNTAYWQGKSYLGIGPSAHSFNGEYRSWNISNNIKYIKSISEKKLPIERELLSVNDRYNEYIMTGLRTMWGVSLLKVESDFGKEYVDYVLNQAQKEIEKKHLILTGDCLKIDKKGKFLSDGIASNLFKID